MLGLNETITAYNLAEALFDDPSTPERGPPRPYPRDLAQRLFQRPLERRVYRRPDADHRSPGGRHQGRGNEGHGHPEATAAREEGGRTYDVGNWQVEIGEFRFRRNAPCVPGTLMKEDNKHAHHQRIGLSAGGPAGDY